MTDLDPTIREYYDDQTLDEAVMERLLRMDAAGATESEPPRKGLPWWRYAAFAAGIALAVGGLAWWSVGPTQPSQVAAIPTEIAVPVGLRPIRVPVEDSAIVSFMERGAAVDLLLTAEGKTRTLEQGLIVVERDATSVTVLTDARGAKQIAHAQTVGDVRLTLRSAIDELDVRADPLGGLRSQVAAVPPGVPIIWRDADDGERDGDGLVDFFASDGNAQGNAANYLINDAGYFEGGENGKARDGQASLGSDLNGLGYIDAGGTNPSDGTLQIIRGEQTEGLSSEQWMELAAAKKEESFSRLRKLQEDQMKREADGRYREETHRRAEAERAAGEAGRSAESAASEKNQVYSPDAVQAEQNARQAAEQARAQAQQAQRSAEVAARKRNWEQTQRAEVFVPPRAQATPSRIDALSTFSVDVDTASWTRTRTGLAEGYLPNRREVRIEEFVNAFRYDYETPSDGPFAASIEIVPSLWDPTKHLVRIGIQGKRISVFERKPVHLTLLVDVSGSMNGADRLPLLKRGLTKLVGELKDGDTVALVTYAGNTRVALEPTPISRRGQIVRAIQGLSSSGGTAMGAGIDLAYGLAQETLEPGAINRVVIASDGDANVGVTDADALSSKIRAAADRGITLTTLGFGGGNYRDDVMERLADKGDGAYHWIGDDRDAQKVLVDDLTGTLQVIARDVKIQVEFDPATVTDWRQIGYDNRQIADRDFRNDRVDAGEVGAGHQVTALYEVTLVNPTATSVLGQLRLRYERPGAEGATAVERRTTLSGTPRERFQTASEDTRVAAVAAAFADRLRGQPGLSMSTLDDLLPLRVEYREQDDRLRKAIRDAAKLGL